MNRKEMIAAIASKTGMTKTASATALKAMLDTIGESLGRNEPVSLVGFGNFVVGQRAARQGRNPKTNAVMQIPGGKVPRFKASAPLRRQVAGK